MGHGGEELVAPDLARVEPADVAAIVKSGDKNVLIVDVRDPKERADGSIASSLNVPSAVFKSDDKAELDSVIKEQLAGAQTIVVHCHFSKIRGPTCAKALSDRIKALGLENAPEVKVLAGGIAGFMEEYKGDTGVAVLPEGGWNPTV